MFYNDRLLKLVFEQRGKNMNDTGKINDRLLKQVFQQRENERYGKSQRNDINDLDPYPMGKMFNRG